MKLFLCLLALAATSAAYRFRSGESAEGSAESMSNSWAFAKPQHEYRFNYDVQLNTGFAPWISAQKAAQRMYSEVRVQFVSEHSAIMRMEHIRVGTVNTELDSNTIKPIQAFETETIESEKLEQLKKPVQFTLGDGIIERIHFDKEEPVWSRNIKKAVLGLVQLNKREMGAFEKMGKSPKPRVFTMEEPTIEGVCQTVYTMIPVNADEINVTKSIDFTRCSKLADSAFGFQGAQSAYQLALTQGMRKSGEIAENKQMLANSLEQPIPTEKLSRSTVYRYQLRRSDEADKFIIRNVEMVAQYAIRSTKTETELAMQTVGMSRLQLREVQKKTVAKLPANKLDAEESLVYNARVEAEEKRFYMYGDEMFAKNVFETKHESESKIASKIHSIIKKIAQEFEKKSHDSKLELVAEIENAVVEMRKLSVKALNKLEDECTAVEKPFFYDLCAIAGTRNTIMLVAQRMPEMPEYEILKVLKSIAGTLIAPSDRIAQIVLDVCEKFEKMPAGKSSIQQSCWLTFSSIVGQVQKQQYAAKNSLAYPTRLEETQQEQKLAAFAAVLSKKLEDAETVYERVLAIKCIGNAGMPAHLPLLEKIIRGQSSGLKKEEETTNMRAFMRAECIDALRRMRFTHAARIQQILMPVFVDAKQPAEVRMSALSMLVSTLPAGRTDARTLLDQISYVLANERCEQVRAFTYSLMKSYGKSPLPIEKEIAMHLQNTLKITNIGEEEQLKRASRHIRIPIYNHAEREGLFMGMSAQFVPHAQLPSHVSAYVDSMLNGMLDKHTVYVSVCQHNADKWLQRVLKSVRKSVVNAARNTESRYARDELRKLIENIKVEQRSYADEEPFAMATLRVKDVDQAVFTIDERLAKRIGENLNEGIEEIAREWGFHRRALTAVQEKQIRIPTACGMPIRMRTMLPIIAEMNANGKVEWNAGARAQATIELRRVHMLAAQQQYVAVECAFVKRALTGVSSWRAIELQAPKKIQITAQYQPAKGMHFKLVVPAQEMPLLNVRTLPATFVGYTPYEQLNTIDNVQLLTQQREISIDGQRLKISGLVHKPLSFSEPKELLKILMTTENHIKIDWIQTSELKKEIKMHLDGGIFEPTPIDEARPSALNDFYAKIAPKNANKYTIWSGEEDKSFMVEKEEELSRRQQHVTKFMETYAERVNAAARNSHKAYKHWLKLRAETPEGVHAELLTSAVCDASFIGCRIEMNIARSLTNAESKQCDADAFKLKLKAHTLMPERIEESSEEEEEKKTGAHDAFISNVNVEWGCRKSHDEKKVKLHLAVRPQPNFPRQLPVFMNQYEMNAEYELPAHYQRYAKIAYEMLKSSIYWQSTVMPLNEPESVRVYEPVGTIQARLRIEPFDRRFANLTIQTPVERVHAVGIAMPYGKAPRWRTQRYTQRANIHSTRALFAQLADSMSAKCSIKATSGKTELIETFAHKHYRAPLSTHCFTVLAKDCANVGEPAFVVLAKHTGIKAYKTLKIVNREQVIECIGARDGLNCKLNGETIKPTNVPVEHIRFDGETMYARVEGVSVHFDGERIQIRLAGDYLRAQCGLCGTFNPNTYAIEEEEMSRKSKSSESTEFDSDAHFFYNAANKPADNIADFHRSYSVVDNECTEEKRNNFYKSAETKNQFRMIGAAEKMERRWAEMNDNMENSWETLNEQQYYGTDRWNTIKSSESNEKTNEESNEWEENKEIEPEQKIKIIEYKHKLCFSIKPVNKCARNTYPMSESVKNVKVQFGCFDRHSVEARRLLRECRQSIGQSLKTLADRYEIEVMPSFVDTIEVPEKCKRHF